MTEEMISAEEFEGWEGMFAAIGRAIRRGNLPKFGETVEKNGKPHVLTTVNADGRVGWTEIPDGMTAGDLGRKFPSTPTLWECV